ncbi:DUF4124 domain-containing protein [Hahella sp. KA22]|uniref:DUF4124 domain-containing protein n=1 Tax=Hahella sp. KA22 TaxID=1628392 RepID=UPI000FDD2BA6|nr:DUF4124 domain-containing protein [Hahella sp. KA22]AZZ94352.1 DUF4124 domain-containing protein [Hahella sp. KA22]QAY57726.1 DUF4124 domain-containing protein [Hahella sp. KA22]
MRTAIFSIFLLSISSLSFASGVYKWTDENGVIHYSDKKPDFKTSEELNVQTGTPTKERQDLDAQSKELSDQQELERLKQQQIKENAEADERQKKVCELLKVNLETLMNNARIREEQEDGSQRFMTPEEILQKRKDTQALIDEKCGAQ